MHADTFFLIFLSFFSTATLLHLIGLYLLIRVRSKPLNQWKILVNMAVAELSVSVFQIIMACYRSIGTQLYVEIFFRAWVSLMYIALMIYLAIDRMLSIYLHMRYLVIFTRSRVTIILVIFWTTCAVLAAKVKNFGSKMIFEQKKCINHA